MLLDVRSSASSDMNTQSGPELAGRSDWLRSPTAAYPKQSPAEITSRMATNSAPVSSIVDLGHTPSLTDLVVKQGADLVKSLLHEEPEDKASPCGNGADPEQHSVPCRLGTALDVEPLYYGSESTGELAPRPCNQYVTLATAVMQAASCSSAQKQIHTPVRFDSDNPSTPLEAICSRTEHSQMHTPVSRNLDDALAAVAVKLNNSPHYSIGSDGVSTHSGGMNTEHGRDSDLQSYKSTPSCSPETTKVLGTYNPQRAACAAEGATTERQLAPCFLPQHLAQNLDSFRTGSVAARRLGGNHSSQSQESVQATRAASAAMLAYAADWVAELSGTNPAKAHLDKSPNATCCASLFTTSNHSM